MTRAHEYQPEERVEFNHCEGYIKATVLELNHNKSLAKLKIDGWLGEHWESVSKLRPI